MKNSRANRVQKVLMMKWLKGIKISEIF